MSQQRSLRSRSMSRQHRNVLKRFERIKALSGFGRWAEGDPVYGLPKVRSIKERVKRGKVAAAATATGAEGAAADGAPAKGAAKVGGKGASGQ